MKIKELYIYPIKSLCGIKVPTAEVLEKGFKHDRRWMLVDEFGNFITQRKHPELSKFKVALEKNNIIVSSDKLHKVSIPHKLHIGELISVAIWDSRVDGLKASDEINSWFSKALNLTCSLVYMPENYSRLVNSQNITNEVTVSFADGYPYLIVGQSSIDDLNSRMESSLPTHRFRPNIVFSGGHPYEEDKWNEFQLGAIRYQGIKPCTRCVFTTIDQETGKSGKEPLKTLATYRRSESGGVIFGLNSIAFGNGVLNVGDPIIVNNKRE